MTKDIDTLFNDLANALISDDRDCDISFLAPIYIAAKSGEQLSADLRMELSLICEKYEIDFAF